MVSKSHSGSKEGSRGCGEELSAEPGCKSTASSQPRDSDKSLILLESSLPHAYNGERNSLHNVIKVETKFCKEGNLAGSVPTACDS